MLNRDKILDEAFERCMEEMYLRAQPSVSYKELVEGVKNGTIEDSKTNPIYDRYYLSHEEFKYILDKYIKAYRIQEEWHSNIELLEKYLTEGGTKDKYIKAHTDEDGNYHPGYRGYEKVPSLKNQIIDFLKRNVTADYDITQLGEDITKIAMDNINDCKEFYRFNREENSFSTSIALGASPTSNPDSVKEYWKSQGIDIEIEERNPLLFWERDYYGDEFEEVMIDEYGEDWKEQFDKQWKDKIRKETEEKEKRIAEMKKELEKIKQSY